MTVKAIKVTNKPTKPPTNMWILLTKRNTIAPAINPITIEIPSTSSPPTGADSIVETIPKMVKPATPPMLNPTIHASIRWPNKQQTNPAATKKIDASRE